MESDASRSPFVTNPTSGGGVDKAAVATWKRMQTTMGMAAGPEQCRQHRPRLEIERRQRSGVDREKRERETRVVSLPGGPRKDKGGCRRCQPKFGLKMERKGHVRGSAAPCPLSARTRMDMPCLFGWPVGDALRDDTPISTSLCSGRSTWR